MKYKILKKSEHLDPEPFEILHFDDYYEAVAAAAELARGEHLEVECVRFVVMSLNVPEGKRPKCVATARREERGAGDRRNLMTWTEYTVPGTHKTMTCVLHRDFLNEGEEE